MTNQYAAGPKIEPWMREAARKIWPDNNNAFCALGVEPSLEVSAINNQQWERITRIIAEAYYADAARSTVNSLAAADALEKALEGLYPFYHEHEVRAESDCEQAWLRADAALVAYRKAKQGS